MTNILMAGFGGIAGFVGVLLYHRIERRIANQRREYVARIERRLHEVCCQGPRESVGAHGAGAKMADMALSL